MDEFEDFVVEANLLRVETFPWASFPDALHNLYAHSIAKMRRIGGRGLAMYRLVSSLHSDVF